MHSTRIAICIAFVVVSSSASPMIGSRLVTQLDGAAFQEAQQRDDTATRAFSDVQIKTMDGRCLFVDELSGDFRANLTPIQITECGATDGQGWDVITSGKHNNVAGSVLVVSTLVRHTNLRYVLPAADIWARPKPALTLTHVVPLETRCSCSPVEAELMVIKGGTVTNSQLFPFNGTSGRFSFSPENQPDSCLSVRDNVIYITPCSSGNESQVFVLSEAVPGASGSTASTTTATSGTNTASQTIISIPTTAITATLVPSATSTALSDHASLTTGVPVSRAGGTLVPSAVAESQERDDTAMRAFASVSIQAPNGQCLSIDPTAGDFRQNLIPVSLVACAGTANEKFDVITAGKHNNAQNAALIVSSLTNGCITHDGRRPAGDTVTLFSCGGRAAGDGETNSGQLVPFTGGEALVLAPLNAANATCIVPGNGRLDSAPCTNDDIQVFTIRA